MRNTNEIKINFIRHGKTELNEKHCYIGVTDSCLSENGKKEIIDKINNSIYPNTDIVFTSPMKRCVETAGLIFTGKKIIVIDEFREMDFGSFEGKCYDELKNNQYYRRWIDESRGASREEIEEAYGHLNDESRDVILPEDRESFSKRNILGLKKLILNSMDKNTVSVVAHGGTIMAIVSEFSKEDYYKFMVSCAEGIETTVTYINENGNIEISRISVNNWIRS